MALERGAKSRSRPSQNGIGPAPTYREVRAAAKRLTAKDFRPRRVAAEVAARVERQEGPNVFSTGPAPPGESDFGTRWLAGVRRMVPSQEAGPTSGLPGIRTPGEVELIRRLRAEQIRRLVFPTSAGELEGMRGSLPAVLRLPHLTDPVRTLTDLQLAPPSRVPTESERLKMLVPPYADDRQPIPPALKAEGVDLETQQRIEKEIAAEEALRREKASVLGFGDPRSLVERIWDDPGSFARFGLRTGGQIAEQLEQIPAGLKELGVATYQTVRDPNQPTLDDVLHGRWGEIAEGAKESPLGQLAQASVQGIREDFEKPYERFGYILPTVLAGASLGASGAFRAASALGAASRVAPSQGLLRGLGAAGREIVSPTPPVGRLTVPGERPVDIEVQLSRNPVRAGFQIARYGRLQRSLDKGQGEGRLERAANPRQGAGVARRAAAKVARGVQKTTGPFTAQRVVGRELRAQRRVDQKRMQAPANEHSRHIKGLTLDEHKAIQLVSWEGRRALDRPAEVVADYRAKIQEWIDEDTATIARLREQLADPALDLAAKAREGRLGEIQKRERQIKENETQARLVEAAGRVLDRPTAHWQAALESTRVLDRHRTAELRRRGVLGETTARRRPHLPAAVMAGEPLRRDVTRTMREGPDDLRKLQEGVARLKENIAESTDPAQRRALGRDLRKAEQALDEMKKRIMHPGARRRHELVERLEAERDDWVHLARDVVRMEPRTGNQAAARLAKLEGAFSSLLSRFEGDEGKVDRQTLARVNPQIGQKNRALSRLSAKAERDRSRLAQLEESMTTRPPRTQQAREKRLDAIDRQKRLVRENSDRLQAMRADLTDFRQRNLSGPEKTRGAAEERFVAQLDAVRDRYLAEGKPVPGPVAAAWESYEELVRLREGVERAREIEKPTPEIEEVFGFEPRREGRKLTSRERAELYGRARVLRSDPVAKGALAMVEKRLAHARASLDAYAEKYGLAKTRVWTVKLGEERVPVADYAPITSAQRDAIVKAAKQSGIRPERIGQLMEISDARARAYSPDNPAEFYERIDASWGSDLPRGALLGGRRGRGVVEFTDGQVVLEAFRGSSFDSFLHGIAQIVRRDLDGQLLDDLGRHLGIRDGKWSARDERRFADLLVEHVRGRDAPAHVRRGVGDVGPQLVRRVVRAARRWIAHVWASVSKRPEMRDTKLRQVFDRILADVPAPDRPGYLTRQVEAFYTPIMSVLEPQRASTFTQRVPGEHGITTPDIGRTDPSLTHELTGRSIREGSFTAMVAEAQAVSYAKMVRLVSGLDMVDRLIGVSTATRTSRWQIPVRDPNHLPRELKRMIAEENGHIGLEALRTFNDADADRTLREILHPAEKDGVQLYGAPIGTQVTGIRWVDERFIAVTGATIGPGHAKAQLVVSYPNDVAKILSVYGRVAYILNLPGNIGMQVIHQGFMAPHNYRRAWRMRRWAGDRIASTVESLVGEGKAKSFTIDPNLGRTGVERISHSMAAFWSHWIDRPSRASAFLHEAWLRGYKTRDDLERLLFDPANAQELSRVTRAANKALVEFDNLTPFEKDVLRHWVFFYPWMSRSAVWALRTMFEHPAKAWTLMELSQVAEEKRKEQLGPLPRYLRQSGFFPVLMRDETYAYVVNANSVNTFSSPVEIGRVLLGLVLEGERPRVEELSSPGAQFLAAILTGGDSRNDSAVVQDALRRFYEGLGPYQVLRRMGVVDDEDFSKEKLEDQPVLQGRSLMEGLGPFLLGGLWPRGMRLDVAHAKARKEKRDRMTPAQRVLDDIRVLRDRDREAARATDEALVQAGIGAQALGRFESEPVRKAFGLRMKRGIAERRLASRLDVELVELTELQRMSSTLRVYEEAGLITPQQAASILGQSRTVEPWRVKEKREDMQRQAEHELTIWRGKTNEARRAVGLTPIDW